jgi:DUF971 family protein
LRIRKRNIMSIRRKGVADSGRVGEFTWEVVKDAYAEHPYEAYDMLSQMLFSRSFSHYSHCPGVSESTQQDWRNFSQEPPWDDLIYLTPIYAYSHGRTTFSLRPFSDRWDSGQVGWLFVTREAAEQNWPKYGGWVLAKCAERQANQEFKVFEDWVDDGAYGWQVKDKDGEVVDSCWEYYEREAAIHDAEAAARGFANEAAQDLAETIDEMFAFSGGCL